MPQPSVKARRKPMASPPDADLTPAQLAGVMPLDYMLSVIRDPSADPNRRDRLAIAAAQYCHSRAVDNRATKRSRAARAAATAGGAGSIWGDDLDADGDGRLQQ